MIGLFWGWRDGCGDQHSCIGDGDHLGLGQAFFERLVAGDYLGGPVIVHFGRARDFQSALDHLLEFVFVDRFRQESECTTLRCYNRVGNSAVSGDDDDAKAGRACLKFFEQPDAVHLVHAQIRDDEIGPKTMQDTERFVGALDGFHVIVVCSKPYAEEAQQPRVVIDEQDLAFGFWCCLCHVSSIAC